MANLYTLRQQPVLQRKIWGGRKLADLFDKPLPEGHNVGESWEVADHPHGTSRVADGPLQGTTLRRIVADHADELYGPACPDHWRARFPLLVKIIDAARDLSIQVHPGSDYIANHGIHDSPKTEAWVVLQADPGSRLITGVVLGTRPEAFRRAARERALDDLLVSAHVGPGDVVFLPAGRLHAIGGGMVLAEFQQPSDTTFRVYDWGRAGPDGRPRGLHLDEAMACINFSGEFPGADGRGVVSDDPDATVESLVERPEFTVHRATVRHGRLTRPLDRGFECAMITGGEGEIASALDDRPVHLTKGQTVLVPAAAGSYELRTDGTLTALLSGVPRP